MTVAQGRAEWLEADGLGGFASGTANGIRTRRYHALLLTASTPPSGRFLLVNGVEAWVSRGERAFALTSERYAGDVEHPDGARRIEAFAAEPWPRFSYRLEDGAVVEHEVLVPRGAPLVVLTWRAREAEGLVLSVRPFLSGRDPHALHHENPAFRFDAEIEQEGRRVRIRPYADVPALLATTNGRYEHAPEWYRSFLYEEERARGLDCVEDLASPGTFRFDLSRGEAQLVLAAEGASLDAYLEVQQGLPSVERLRATERERRRSFPSPLHRAADAYLVRRGSGETIVAGYPWFGDWGRDTFIALRGLCLATGRLQEAGRILVAWAGAVSEGMLPNRFPDRGDMPEYNSVDASLWFVIAVHEYQQASGERSRTLAAAVAAILAGYARGTRFGIRVDEDGLLASGAPGVQLTWMDAKVGDRVLTPRTGKAVEIQALWLNALALASVESPEWRAPLERGLRSFEEKFWNEEQGCLHDVVDVDHVPGRIDATFRPNQIFAVGGLPMPLVTGERARRIVDEVERRLLTPLGLRSLAPGEPGYAPRYEGGVSERDAAYHQGTVWPWLLGPFVEAWVRVRGGTAAVRNEARQRFLEPLLARLEEAGIVHVPEITDAEPPYTLRGCPFQAWSVGEMLRLRESVLSELVPIEERRRGSS